MSAHLGSPAEWWGLFPAEPLLHKHLQACGGLSQLGTILRQDGLSLLCDLGVAHLAAVLWGILRQGFVARSRHRKGSVSGTQKKLQYKGSASLGTFLLKSIDPSPEPPASRFWLLPRSDPPNPLFRQTWHYLLPGAESSPSRCHSGTPVWGAGSLHRLQCPGLGGFPHRLQ